MQHKQRRRSYLVEHAHYLRHRWMTHDLANKDVPPQASPFCDEEWAETGEGNESLGTVEDRLQAADFMTDGPSGVPADGNCQYDSTGCGIGRSAAVVAQAGGARRGARSPSCTPMWPIHPFLP